MPHRPLITLLLLALTALACTLSRGADSANDTRIVTATLSDEVRPITELPTADALTLPTETAFATPPTATPASLYISTNLPTSTATHTPTGTPTSTPPHTPTGTLTGTLTSIPTHTPTDTPSHTPHTLPIATALPGSTPLSSSTPTLPAPPTITPPPTFTPLPTIPPTPVPTRTIPGPPPLMPLGDGSGTLIPDTGNTAATSPIADINALPHTLYYLSDVGDQTQVFRLRIGLNHPDQLTYSPTGVVAFSVAPDGTMAYVDLTGNMTIGGVPVSLPANAAGSLPQITALAWSPDGAWLAYVQHTANAPADTDGLYIRNREGMALHVAQGTDIGADAAYVLTGPLLWHSNSADLLVRV